MSETKPTLPTLEPITDEQLAKIGGGECTPQDWIDIFGQLKDSYETLVDFTSYVIERVASSSGS